MYYPPASQDDITWFKNALEHQERKFFVAFVLKEPRTVPEILYEPMMRAAVYERDQSFAEMAPLTESCLPTCQDLQQSQTAECALCR